MLFLVVQLNALFSCLKIIKNYLRSTRISLDRLNALDILSIEHEFTNQLWISKDNIIEDCSEKKSRRTTIF